MAVVIIKWEEDAGMGQKTEKNERNRGHTWKYFYVQL